MVLSEGFNLLFVKNQASFTETKKSFYYLLILTIKKQKSMKKLFTLLFAFAILFSANAQILDEGFETSVPPTGWVEWQSGAGTSHWLQSTTNVHSGTYNACASYNSAGPTEQWLVTSHLIPNATNNLLTFWLCDYYFANYGSSFVVAVSTSSQTSPADFTPVQTYLESDVTNNTPAQMTVDLSAYNDMSIYVAFIMYDDDGDRWYIDDVSGIEQAPAAHDIGVDLVKPTFVNSGDSYTPKVTLHNYGTETESDFDVIVTIDDGTKAEVYRDTVFLTGESFLSGDDKLVTMEDEWTTPGDGTYSVNAEVVLTGDENASNDVLNGTCNVAEGSIAYCWPQGTQSEITQGPSYFFLEDPDAVYNLAEELTKYVYAGAWAQNVWYAAYYTAQDLVSIDKETGAVTVIGDLGVSLNGMAYDNSTNTMYGINNTSLYTIDPGTGAATLVGDLGVASSAFGNLACSESGDLYSVNRDDDALYSVDETTPAATIVGIGLGINVESAQDMEYDAENDILYMAAYEAPGVSNLRTVDVVTGVASAPIGAFPGSQICGFAIPYTSPTDILTYSFPEQAAPADINYIDHTIDIDVVYGTDVTALIADFTLVGTASAEVGGTPQVSGTTANDFTSPVTYTVTGDDLSTQDWLVTVGVAQNTATDILTYSLPGQTGSAAIYPVSEEVYVDFPFGTDVSNLIATFTLSDGATADIGGTPQESGVTPNDFTSPVNYTVTAENGTDVAYWTVYANIADNDSTDILAYSFPEQTGAADIDDGLHTVEIEVAYGTDVTTLVADFELSTGATATVGGNDQISGNTINDFTNPVTYAVEAEDGVITQDWTVTVTVAPVTYTVTFNVDMDQLTTFDPATQEVYVSGGDLAAGGIGAYERWAQPGTNVDFLMTDLDVDGIYTLDLTDVSAGDYEYKYFWIDTGTPSWDNGYPDVNASFSVVDADVVLNDIWTVGIEDLTAKGISIYPNPSNGVFNVNVKETFNLEVIDITGKIVKTQVLDNNTNTVNITDSGFYVLKFTNKNNSVIHRIIVN